MGATVAGWIAQMGAAGTCLRRSLVVLAVVLIPLSQALPVQADYIEGTSGADLLNGTGEDDIIWAYGGADTVNGKGGADEMHLGSGGDTSSGGDGRDSTYGGASGSTFGTADVMHGNQG